MLQETLNHLKQRNLLLGDQVDHGGVADRCVPVLLEQPVESSNMDEISEKAMIVAEIRYRLFGEAESEDVEKELDGIISAAVAATGKVQTRLENGYVLCSAQVSRRLSLNGEGSIPIRRSGRFVTSDAATIEQFYWNPAASRLHSSMQAMRKRLEIGTSRQPELEARRPKLIEKAYEQIQLELPKPDQQS